MKNLLYTLKYAFPLLLVMLILASHFDGAITKVFDLQVAMSETDGDLSDDNSPMETEDSETEKESEEGREGKEEANTSQKQFHTNTQLDLKLGVKQSLVKEKWLSRFSHYESVEFEAIVPPPELTI